MEIITGIASTTYIDAHHERFAKEALDGMAEQIRSRFIPCLIEHDPNRQVGVILYGRVEPLADGEFALLTVSGLFDNEEEKSLYLNRAPNTVWQDYVHHLDGVAAEIEQQTPTRENQSRDQIPEYDPDNIAALLETHLDSTSIWLDGRVYKIKHLIASTGDLSIHVYRDHPPPHFHIISRQRSIDARFHLDTLEPIEDSTSSRDVKKIKDFFLRTPDALKKLRDEHARMQE